MFSTFPVVIAEFYYGFFMEIKFSRPRTDTNGAYYIGRWARGQINIYLNWRFIRLNTLYFTRLLILLICEECVSAVTRNHVRVFPVKVI